MHERPKQTAFPLWEAVCAKTTQAPYTILYEDEAVLVCAKQAGVPVQSKDLRTPDLESMLRVYLTKRQNGCNEDRANGTAGKEDISGVPYLGIVHRLDQPVCGVLVFAKTPKAAAALSKQARDGTMGKEYLAVCDISGQQNACAGQQNTEVAGQGKAGAAKQSQGGEAGQGKAGAAKQSQGGEAAGRAHTITVTDYLVKDGRTNLSRVAPEGTKGAKRAVLEMEVLETQEAQSLVRVRLHTGRHHQIRVQLAHAGLPVIGDRKYGQQAGRDGQAQLQLCAYRLSFTHPLTGKRMTFDLSDGNG